MGGFERISTLGLTVPLYQLKFFGTGLWHVFLWGKKKKKKETKHVE